MLFLNILGSLEGLYENSVKGSQYSVVAHRIVLAQCTYYVINFKRIKTGVMIRDLIRIHTSNKYVSCVLEVRPARRTDASAPLSAGVAFPPPPLLAVGR